MTTPLNCGGFDYEYGPHEVCTCVEGGPITDGCPVHYEFEIEPCPMGCGRTTEDPYGGPCSKCWEGGLDVQRQHRRAVR